MSHMNRINRSYAARLRKVRATVTHAELTDADNGDHQDITLLAVPAGGVLLSLSWRINTYFTGGSATAVDVTAGVAGDPDAILAGPLNIFDTTAEDVWLTGTAGGRPHGQYGGESIIARFDIDAGHALLGLTAGSIDFDIVYVVPDEGT